VADYASEEGLLPAYNRLNEPTFSTLAAARQGDGFTRLGSQLGTALFGGDARDLRGQQIFNQAAKTEASTQDILAQARQRRDMEIGRQSAAKALYDKGDNEGANIVLNSQSADQAQQALLRRNQLKGLSSITDALGGIGYSPQQSDLGSALFSANNGANPQNAIEALQRASLGAAGTPTPAVPQSSQVLSHALVPNSTHLADGMLYDTTAPATQAPNVTPVGTANIAQKNAQATAEYAQAKAATARAENAGNTTFTGDQGELLAALTERGVSLPAGFRSRAQIQATLGALMDRNPDKTVDQVADLVKSGQIDLGAAKKETQTAAAVAGRVGIAQNELGTFAPLVRQASAAVPRGSFMPVNQLLQAADTQISDPRLLQLKIGINSMLNAYDMLAARGGTDVAKRAEAHSLLTSAQSPEALEAGIQMFEREAQAAGQAADQAMHKHSSLGSAMATPTVPGPTKIIGGKTYVNHNGQWYEQ